MSKRLMKFKHELCVLANPNVHTQVKTALMKYSVSDLIYSICEIVLNLCSGTVPLSYHDKCKLKKIKPILRKLLNRKRSVETKRKLLVQRGKGKEFFPVMLKPILQHVLKI